MLARQDPIGLGHGTYGAAAPHRATHANANDPPAGGGHGEMGKRSINVHDSTFME